MGVSKKLLEDYLRHWDYMVDMDPTINVKHEFKEVSSLIRSYYGPKVEQWSKIIIPIDTNDKHNLFSYTSNGIESTHRTQNRFIKEYNKGNMGTIAKQLVNFYEHQYEEVEAIRTGNRQSIIWSFMEGLTISILRLEVQSNWVDNVTTISDLTVFASRLRDANFKAKKICWMVEMVIPPAFSEEFNLFSALVSLRKLVCH